MSLETQISALATRIGQEFKEVAPYRPGGFQPSPAVPGTRRAQYAFGSGGIDSVTTYNTGHQRMPFELPVATKQWRIRISNRPPIGAAPTLPAITCNGIWMGEAYRDTVTGVTNTWYVGNPVQALSSFTIPANGAEYVSPWVTASNLQFVDVLKAYQISMGWTKTVNGSVIYRGSHGAANDTTAANASVGAPFIGVQVATFFSVSIEYEFVGSNKTFVAMGDSNTEGWGNLYGYNTWHQRLSRRMKMPIALSADFGSTAAQWAAAPLTDPGWTRISPANTGLNIDGAIVSLGTNDASTSRTLAQYQADMYTIRNRLVAMGIKDVYFTTIAPANFGTTPEAIRKSYNAWMVSGAADVTDVLDFNSALESTVGAATLRTDFNFGDNIHWNDAAMYRLNQAIPFIGN